jgi:hypothetical protein
MPSDLDQAYIINGDDLRIALGERKWVFDEATGKLISPAAVARYVLADVARPYEARTADVQALARVLRDYAIGIRNPVPGALEGTAVGKVVNPEALAETLLEEMDGKAHPMPLCDCGPRDGSPCPFHTMGGNLADCTCPRCPDCGMPASEHAGGRFAPLPASPAGASGSLTGIEDRELDAMQAILDALDGLTPATRRRIAIWLDNRTTEEPPF